MDGRGRAKETKDKEDGRRDEGRRWNQEEEEGERHGGLGRTTRKPGTKKMDRYRTEDEGKRKIVREMKGDGGIKKKKRIYRGLERTKRKPRTKKIDRNTKEEGEIRKMEI